MIHFTLPTLGCAKEKMSTSSSSLKDWVTLKLGGKWGISSELKQMMCMTQVFAPMFVGFLASRLKQRLTRCGILLGSKNAANSWRTAVTTTVTMPLTPRTDLLSSACMMIAAKWAASLRAWTRSVPSLDFTAAWAVAMACNLAGSASWAIPALNPLKADPHANGWISCLCNVPVVLLSPVKAWAMLWNHWMISRAVLVQASKILKANLTFVESASVGSTRRSTWARSSFLFTVVGSGTNGSTGFLLVPQSLDTVSFMIEWSW